MNPKFLICLKVLSFVGGISLLFFYWVKFGLSEYYSKLSYLVFAGFLILLAIADKIYISNKGLYIELERVKDSVKAFKNGFSLMIPIITHTMDQKPNLMPEGNRICVYKLIQDIKKKNYDLDPTETETALKTLKSFLLTWVLNHMKAHSIINKLVDDKRLQYKPATQDGMENLLREKIKKIDNDMKDTTKIFELEKKIKDLKDESIISILNADEQKVYRQTCDFYSNTIKTFINDDVIDQDFLQTGKIPPF